MRTVDEEVDCPSKEDLCSTGPLARLKRTRDLVKTEKCLLRIATNFESPDVDPVLSALEDIRSLGPAAVMSRHPRRGELDRQRSVLLLHAALNT